MAQRNPRTAARILLWALALVVAAAAPGVVAGAEPAPIPSPDEVAAGMRLSPKAFRAAVEQVMPSVVGIETFGGVTGRLGNQPGARMGVAGVSKPGEGPTTGLIVSPDGLVITSTYNFIRKPPIITVVLHDGSQHVAKILGRDETRKLCLLKIEDAHDLPVPRFVASTDLNVGQWAISVGLGYGGAEPAISTGIVSATQRVSGHAVQTDAKISPANYGGPLIDVDGKVIGVCVPLSPMGQGVDAGVEWYDSGIGFAIPLFGSEQWLDQLQAGKTIQPGKLGIQVAPPGPGSGGAKGVAVMKVGDKSAGKAAGLKPGDVILAIEGDSVLDQMDLHAIMGRYAAGDEITLTVKRGAEEKQIKVRLEVGAEDVPPSGAIPVPKPPPATQPGPAPGPRPQPRPVKPPAKPL